MVIKDLICRQELPTKGTIQADYCSNSFSVDCGKVRLVGIAPSYWLTVRKGVDQTNHMLGNDITNGRIVMGIVECGVENEETISP